ncbi:FkbM family methyltransferase [Methanobrevibacter sp.]|uniref:FkbM family methyltransferase n=1 Tax=Methanobrevibacter sp. TaxID=66852 RepID=UPI0026DEDF2F|nr:FkbM family methyltransferase [Methanobrevibacter sp.]MDO5861157.1 FkbM family methyltransferase [Methanobrevibacter sp.]
MSFKEKVLSKSNSYNFYKEQNEELLKKNKELEKELRTLKKELFLIKTDESNILKKEYDNLKNVTSFCSWDLIEFYLTDEYEDKLKEVTKHLPSYAKKIFKWYFLRAMVVSMIRRDTLYFNYELENQEKFTNFKLNNSGKNEIAGFKFTGSYNIHPFIESGLSEKDLEYIKDKDIIDAGAFTGDTSLPLYKLTSKNIYAFEPFKESYELLKKNINDNNIENIIPINKSLGNINGERSLFLSGNNVQGITNDPEIRPYDEVLKVQETTVDQFVEENNLNVGYITIDVEGAEMDLLEGAINTIKTQKPILFISIYHKVSDYFDIIPWVANLDVGYEFNVLKDNPWSFLADTMVQCRLKYD